MPIGPRFAYLVGPIDQSRNCHGWSQDHHSGRTVNRACERRELRSNIFFSTLSHLLQLTGDGSSLAATAPMIDVLISLSLHQAGRPPGRAVRLWRTPHFIRVDRHGCFYRQSVIPSRHRICAVGHSIGTLRYAPVRIKLGASWSMPGMRGRGTLSEGAPRVLPASLALPLCPGWPGPSRPSRTGGPKTNAKSGKPHCLHA